MSPEDQTAVRPRALEVIRAYRDGGCVVRCLLPGAIAVEVLEVGGRKPLAMERLHAVGVFERVIPGKETLRYRLRATYADGVVRELEDPYRFWPTISEDDLFLLGKGDDHRVYHKLGAQLRTLHSAGRDSSVRAAFEAWTLAAPADGQATLAISDSTPMRNSANRGRLTRR